MIQNVWKKFDEIELSHSSVHYLMAIHTLVTTQGYARSIDISNYLGLTRGSVSITVNKLVAKGYIIEDKNRFFKLSDTGKQLVNAVLSKRRLFERLLSEIMLVNPAIAEEDACKIEHLVTKESSAKILSFMGFYLSDDPKAIAFRKAFSEYNYNCTHQDEHCDVCELECYFAGNENYFRQEK